MTQPPAALLQPSGNPSIQAMSWASIASLPPKKVVSTSTSELSSNNHPLSKGQCFQGNKKVVKTNGVNETGLEEMEGKKKKIRKKKKPKPNSAPLQTPEIENVRLQEPPKIEDDEEFPDLAVSSGERANRFRAARLPPNSQIIELQSEPWDLFPASEKHFGPDLTSPRPMENSRRTARPQSSSSTTERKKTQEATRSKSGGKKSKVPVQLDLGGMLAALEQRHHSEKSKSTSKPVVLSVGSAIPVLSKEPVPLAKHHPLKQGKSPHNPLDSSAPLVKKGKQREVPKAKKPSSLKKIILKEREERKQSRLLEGQGLISLDNESFPQEHNEIAEEQNGSENIQDPTVVTEPTEEEVSAHSVILIQSSSEVTQDTPILSTPTMSPNPSLPKVHSRRFREYCNQVLSKEVDSCVTDLLKELVRFQDRLFQKDPVKAKVKRRLVMGLREVLKHLKLKKLKCVIISPNCERIQSKGGLDETLQTIIACACEQNIPFVFALNRKALGRCVNKAVPVSVVGIFSYDGAQDHFHKMFELTMQARQDYKDMISALEKEQFEDEVAEKQTELKSQVSEIELASLPGLDEDDEPSYIKIWKKMLEKEYEPYSLHLDETAASDMLNLHL